MVTDFAAQLARAKWAPAWSRAATCRPWSRTTGTTTAPSTSPARWTRWPMAARCAGQLADVAAGSAGRPGSRANLQAPLDDYTLMQVVSLPELAARPELVLPLAPRHRARPRAAPPHRASTPAGWQSAPAISRRPSASSATVSNRTWSACGSRATTTPTPPTCCWPSRPTSCCAACAAPGPRRAVASPTRPPAVSACFWPRVAARRYTALRRRGGCTSDRRSAPSHDFDLAAAQRRACSAPALDVGSRTTPFTCAPQPGRMVNGGICSHPRRPPPGRNAAPGV